MTSSLKAVARILALLVATFALIHMASASQPRPAAPAPAASAPAPEEAPSPSLPLEQD